MTALLVIAMCEWLQPNALTALTAIPPWCWLVACVALCCLGITTARRAEQSIAVLVVIGFTGLAVEQSFSVPRSVYASIFRPRENVDAVRLRVVTINCNSGDPSAVREAFAQDPDIVFLQESPNEQAIHELRNRNSVMPEATHGRPIARLSPAVDCKPRGAPSAFHASHPDDARWQAS